SGTTPTGNPPPTISIQSSGKEEPEIEDDDGETSYSQIEHEINQMMVDRIMERSSRLSSLQTGHQSRTHSRSCVSLLTVNRRRLTKLFQQSRSLNNSSQNKLDRSSSMFNFRGGGGKCKSEEASGNSSSSSTNRSHQVKNPKSTR